MWALKASDWKILQVFHTPAICCIFNISIVEVQEQQIQNESLYERCQVDSIESITASRHLHWIGKIALMKESCLPQKFINAWHSNPRLVRRPLTTTCHTYLHALKLTKEIPWEDEDGRLTDWIPTIQSDPQDWDKGHLALISNIVGYVETATLD